MRRERRPRRCRGRPSRRERDREERGGEEERKIKKISLHRRCMAWSGVLGGRGCETRGESFSFAPHLFSASWEHKNSGDEHNYTSL